MNKPKQPNVHKALADAVKRHSVQTIGVDNRFAKNKRLSTLNRIAAIERQTNPDKQNQ